MSDRIVIEYSLWEALMGLYAGEDSDSGIVDRDLRSRCRAMLKTMTEKEIRVELAEFVRDHYLSDEALALGYGVEDVANFYRWFEDGC